MNDPSELPRFSRYEVRECLGEGATAIVYHAWDRELKRPVALKVLRAAAGMSGIARTRFKREASAAAGLVHPNVIAVYDAAEEAGSMYLVMEIVDGRTLEAILQDADTPKKAQIELLEQAARGVAAAHEKGIVHRDLKPANILVGADGTAKVADFGLAHLMDSQSALTRSGAELGTPQYMSPEQVDGRSKEATPATDVHALGAILYELVTGSTPYARPSLQETFAAILSQDPAPLRSSDPKIHPDLETICLKALEKDPQRRYPSAREFADDLRAYLAGDFISAIPVPRWKRRLRRVLQNRVLVAAVVVILLVSGGAVGTLLRQSAATQRRLADERERAQRREASLQQLGSIQSTLLERDRELRLERVPAAQARRDLEAAVAEVDHFVRDWPEFPQGYYVRARGRMLLGDLDGAERDLRNAVARAPDFRPGWSVLGILKVGDYQSQLTGPIGNFEQRVRSLAPLLDEAKTLFSRGWKPGKELDESVRWGLPWTREDQVMERVSRAFQLFYTARDPSGAIALLEEGDREYQAEEYAIWIGVFTGPGKTRIDRLNDAVRRAPGYLPAYYYRAMFAIERRDFRAAITDLDRVVATRTNAAYAWFNRGVANEFLGERENAVRDFTRVLEINPNIALAWLHRGAMYGMMGKKDESLADFDRGVALEPDNPEALENRAVSRRIFGNPDGALEDLERALRLDPKRPSALRQRGGIYMEQRNFAAALAEFDKCVQIDPSSPQSFQGRAMTRDGLGDTGGALQDIEQALRLTPENSPQSKELQRQLSLLQARLKEK